MLKVLIKCPKSCRFWILDLTVFCSFLDGHGRAPGIVHVNGRFGNRPCPLGVILGYFFNIPIIRNPAIQSWTSLSFVTILTGPISVCKLSVKIYSQGSVSPESL